MLWVQICDIGLDDTLMNCAWLYMEYAFNTRQIILINYIFFSSSMSAPPVPPRPYYESTQGRDNSLPPPVPPLPPAVRNEAIRYATPSPYEESPPHFERPLVAPRPHRLDPSDGKDPG